MNELFKLLVENEVALSGEIRNGEPICVITDISGHEIDEFTPTCTLRVNPEDNDMTIKKFIGMFVTPAILAIERNRELLEDNVKNGYTEGVDISKLHSQI